MTMALESFLAMLIQSVVAILFVGSGLFKLLTLKKFINGLLYIPYVERPWNVAIGVALPPTEIAIGTGIWANMQVAKLAAVGLLISFSCVALLAVKQRQSVACNCFGFEDGKVLSYKTVIRNIMLIALVVYSARSPGIRHDAFAGLYALILLTAAFTMRYSYANVREMRASNGDKQKDL